MSCNKEVELVELNSILFGSGASRKVENLLLEKGDCSNGLLIWVLFPAKNGRGFIERQSEILYEKLEFFFWVSKGV